MDLNSDSDDKGGGAPCNDSDDRPLDDLRDGELAKPAGAIAQSVTRSAQQAPLAASQTTRTAPPQGNDSDD